MSRFATYVRTNDEYGTKLAFVQDNFFSQSNQLALGILRAEAGTGDPAERGGRRLHRHLRYLPSERVKAGNEASFLCEHTKISTRRTYCCSINSATWYGIRGRYQRAEPGETKRQQQQQNNRKDPAGKYSRVSMNERKKVAADTRIHTTRLRTRSL